MSIGIGILGFAHGHVGMYCRQWQKMDGTPVRVVAGWDHDAARAQASGNEFKFTPSPTVAAVVENPAVQAVIVASETSMHADLVEQAARAGKPIILQKPIALTIEDADRIVNVVRKTGVAFTLAWQMRVDPQNLEIRRLIRDGTLGRVYMVRRRHGLNTHTWPDFHTTWHVKPELNRGMWADDSSHAIDFLLWLLGEPVTVSAEIATLRRPDVPDDHGIAIFRYADGMMAEVASSFVCLAGENTTEIVAENGVVIQNYGDLVSAAAPRAPDAVGLKWLLKGDKDWTRSPLPSPNNQGVRIVALTQPLLDFMTGRGPVIATAEEGREALRMTLASLRAAELWPAGVSVPERKGTGCVRWECPPLGTNKIKQSTHPRNAHGTA